MVCTTTAIAGSAVRPRAARYATTRAPNREAQQSTMRVSSSSASRTFVKVEFMPAKDASAPSSPTADERTATTGAPRRSHAARTWSASAGGIPAPRTFSASAVHSSGRRSGPAVRASS